MKQKITLVCIVVLTVILSSCSKTDTKAPNYIKIDGKSANLTVGYIGDWSSGDTYEVWKIELASSAVLPSSFINFRIYSSSADGITLGTYTYTYSSYAAGKFSWLEFGKDCVYDNLGSISSGTYFNESSSNVLDGTKIVVSKPGDYYQFDITLNVKDADGNPIVVTGYFSDVLTDMYSKK